MLIITVEIITRGVLPCIRKEAGGIEARAEPKLRIIRPQIFGDKPAHGQRCRRFITVNATGKIDFAMSTCRGAMQRQKANIVFSFQPVDRPPVGLSCNEAITKNSLNIDGLAEIAALIKAQWFHSLGRNRLGSLSRSRSIAGFLFATAATIRLSFIKLLPIRVQTKIAKHLQIFLHWLIERGEIVTHH